jgi:hypothetical protein
MASVLYSSSKSAITAGAMIAMKAVSQVYGTGEVVVSA